MYYVQFKFDFVELKVRKCFSTTDCTDYTDFEPRRRLPFGLFCIRPSSPLATKNPYNPCNPLWKYIRNLSNLQFDNVLCTIYLMDNGNP